MPHQKYFRENFVNQLYGDVVKNLPHYTKDDFWVPEYAAGAVFELESKFEIAPGFALSLPDTEDKKDFENTCKFYDALKSLSPVQATDPRLWTYMSHITFWPYMRRRWQIENSNTKEANKRDYVLSHYFIRSQESRALLRNGIARLWWYGYLTYDSERDNPYELTSVLLRQLDIAQQILERSLGRNRDILHAFLAFLFDHPELTSGGDKGRGTIRTIAKRLNLHGGMCVLDSLDRNDVRQWLEEAFAATILDQ